MLNKKHLSLSISAILLCVSVSAFSQSNKIRYASSSKALPDITSSVENGGSSGGSGDTGDAGDSGQTTITLSANTTGLRGKTVLDSQGQQLSQEDIETVMSLIEAGRSDLLGHVITTPDLFLNNITQSYGKSDVKYSLPDTPDGTPIRASYRATSYSGDNDTARASVQTYDNNNNQLQVLFVTPHTNWSSDGYPDHGTWYTGDYVLYNTDKMVRFFADCTVQSGGGSNCSAHVNRIQIEYYPDLPALGETLTIID